VKARELIPYLVAGQALTVLLLLVLILAMLSYRRTLHDILDLLVHRHRVQRQGPEAEPTRPLRKV
jgi:hypothetical protein